VVDYTWGQVSQGRAGHRLYIIRKDPKPQADLLSAGLSIWDLLYILNGTVHLYYIKHVVTTDKQMTYMTVISYIIILRGESFQKVVAHLYTTSF